MAEAKKPVVPHRNVPTTQTVELVSPHGSCVVAKKDVEKYLAREGWTLKGAAKAKAEPKVEKKKKSGGKGGSGK